MPENCWYKDGLKFHCTQCGACCYKKGKVFVRENELEQIAQYLNMSKEECDNIYCNKKYQKQNPTLYVLKSNFVSEKRYDCIFLKEVEKDKFECIIYPVRPIQCSTFPFWEKRIANKEKWEEMRMFCPGINEGKLYTKEEIDEILSKKK
jgi:uncharacterized protein